MKKLFAQEWISDETGEIYSNIFYALKTIILDIIFCPKCRTWRMFNIRPFND